MINLVSAVRAEHHSQKGATCGMALTRFYIITADFLQETAHKLIARVGFVGTVEVLEDAQDL